MNKKDQGRIMALAPEIIRVLHHCADRLQDYDLPLYRTYFEVVIKSILLELRFFDEVHEAGKSVILGMHNLPKLDKLEYLDQINTFFQTLYDVNHPVRNAVETLDSVEVVRLWLKDNPDYWLNQPLTFS